MNMSLVVFWRGVAVDPFYRPQSHRLGWTSIASLRTHSCAMPSLLWSRWRAMMRLETRTNSQSLLPPAWGTWSNWLGLPWARGRLGESACWILHWDTKVNGQPLTSVWLGGVCLKRNTFDLFGLWVVVPLPLFFFPSPCYSNIIFCNWNS